MGAIQNESTTMSRIETLDDIAKGFAGLIEIDPTFQSIENLKPPLRRRPQGFATLLFAIVAQQVSTASAAAIWARVQAAGLITPDAVSLADEDGLRAVGFSRPKIRYALGLARSGMDYAALENMPDIEAANQLTALPGIGPWTAEIYLLAALGRADVFPAGDLALQEGARILYHLDQRPDEKAMRQMALAWSPWRAIAARYLWEFYRAEKQREGIL